MDKDTADLVKRLKAANEEVELCRKMLGLAKLHSPDPEENNGWHLRADLRGNVYIRRRVGTFNFTIAYIGETGLTTYPGAQQALAGIRHNDQGEIVVSSL